MKRALLSIACAAGLAAALAPVAAAAQEAVLEGFGTDIPLALAVRQIVPDGVRVSYGQGVDLDARVSWTGGADWRTVLDMAARSRNLSVAHSGGGIRISQAGPRAHAAAYPARTRGFVMVPYNAPPLPPEPAPAHEPAPAPEPAPEPVLDHAPAPLPADVADHRAPAAAPVHAAAEPMPLAAYESPPPPVEVWRAPAGMTLDQVLGDWADRAGWTLVFNSRLLYEIQASADFSGDFVEAASALIESIQANPRPLAAFYRGNNALVISNDADQAN